jgi:hypothetical protein
VSTVAGRAGLNLALPCRKWIKKFGITSFDTTYMPLYRIHRKQTSKLPFVRESLAAAEERMLKEERSKRDPAPKTKA